MERMWEASIAMVAGVEGVEEEDTEWTEGRSMRVVGQPWCVSWEASAEYIEEGEKDPGTITTVGFWEIEVAIFENLTCLDLGMVRVIVKILLKLDRKGLFAGLL
jgi:hypothetical protein